MASIHKKNGFWYGAWTDREGKRHFTNTGISHSPIGADAKETKRKCKENKSKALIQALQTEQVSQGSKRIKVIQKRSAALLASARETEAEQSGMTLPGYYDSWVAKKLPNVSPSYGQQLERCKSDLYAALGKRSTTEIVYIDEDDIDLFVDHLKLQKLSGRSINKRLLMLLEMFGDAEDEAFVVANPVGEEHFQDESPVERQPLMPAQVNSILAIMRWIDWITIILLGFYCGMRLGDARSQTWAAIDFEKRVIVRVPKKTKRPQHLKAKVLITPLHPVLYNHLLRVKEMCCDSPYVTPSLVDRPISNLSQEFVAIIVAAGIDPIRITLPNGRKVCVLSFHSLRHAFATLLKRAGAPDKEWATLTGHAVKWSWSNGESISQVAQIYNHIDVEDLRKWIDLLPVIKVPQPTFSMIAADSLTKPLD